MNKDIKQAYTELKNKFGEAPYVVVQKEAAVCKEVISKVEKPVVNEQPKHTFKTKTRASGPTTESLLELQKYFNLK